jgi:hypothetical protein
MRRMATFKKAARAENIPGALSLLHRRRQIQSDDWPKRAPPRLGTRALGADI